MVLILPGEAFPLQDCLSLSRSDVGRVPCPRWPGWVAGTNELARREDTADREWGPTPPRTQPTPAPSKLLTSRSTQSHGHWCVPCKFSFYNVTWHFPPHISKFCRYALSTHLLWRPAFSLNCHFFRVHFCCVTPRLHCVTLSLLWLPSFRYLKILNSDCHTSAHANINLQIHTNKLNCKFCLSRILLLNVPMFVRPSVRSFVYRRDISTYLYYMMF